MKIKSSIGFMLVFVLFQACTKNSTVSCVHNSIQEMKNHHWKGKVLRYNYQGQPVYYVEVSECCDFLSTLYDANCNVLCESGGFAGLQCPDSIMNSLTNEVVVFENP